jgi:Ca2+-binding RTX toxin-like protein
MALTTITVTTDFRVYAGETLNFSNENAFNIQEISGGAPDLIIDGTVNAVMTSLPANSFGSITGVGIGYSGFYDSQVTISATGVLRVISTVPNGQAYGYAAGSWSPDFTNIGLVEVAASGSARGLSTWDAGPWSFSNLGAFHVTSTDADATGVSLANGGRFTNTSEFTVIGKTNVTAVGLNGWDSSFYNAGVIKAVDASATTDSTAVSFTSSFGPNDSFLNLGRIEGDYALKVSPYSSFIGGPMLFTNGAGGVMIGKVDLGFGPATLVNAGVIQGAVDLGLGDDTYNGSAGLLTGVLNGGDGADHIFGGAAGETLMGGSGNDVISGGGGDDLIFGGRDADTLDGGSGVDTASYADATMAVVASLLAGVANSSGVDTLVNFENLIGSSFDDNLTGDAGANRLEGGAGADLLTGAGGADVFVVGVIGAGDTVTDFSHAQGDQIDLQSIHAFHRLSDVLKATRQSGSDTVIAIGAGRLTLRNVQASSLTAADFALTDPAAGSTPTQSFSGGAAIDAKAYSGLSQTYTVTAAGGSATVFGGPAGTADSLTSVERIQFVDGYLATGTTDTAARVYRIYEAALGREPDSNGLANWVGALEKGVALQSIGDGFLNSPEFVGRFGAGDNAAFVTLMYQNVLGRAPDAQGLQSWVSYLASGHSRSEVLTGFSDSPEFVASTAPTVQQGLWVGDANAAKVARLYDTVFDRLPDAQGEAGWTAALNGGQSLQAAANGFVASDEFKAAYGSLDNSRFVQQLYQNVLGRPADNQGLAAWTSFLASGHSRAEVVVGFSESAEHVALTAPYIDNGVWFG